MKTGFGEIIISPAAEGKTSLEVQLKESLTTASDGEKYKTNVLRHQ